ncbi:hypothetical protein [Geodermatophilus sp. DSM 45219]|uniref:hypothetical protein n=1 Tax=Geodermatophilus sp. DSM 45219 TaxID=1881103 RepID=UPI00088DE3E5|nr:hypothetical protein [Geodermatophilus sp. DSM 45219]SDN41368.1 hypothetical protein SAMN05428965_0290 [Geodermatophilus sp. DSM 45219]
MSVPTAVAELTEGCRQLRAEIRSLGLTLSEDAPADLSVVDRLGRAVDDLDGRAEEAHHSALLAAEAAQRLDLVGAQRQLAAAQMALTVLADRYRDDVVSYEALEPVAALRQRGGEWPAWVRVVRQGIDRCRPRVAAVQEAQCRCWQELADRAPIGPVYVQTPGRAG